MESKYYWQIDLPVRYHHDSTHLDLGGGHNPKNPFGASRLIVLDLDSKELDLNSFWDPRARNCDLVQMTGDFTKGLEFQDQSLDSISAFDVLEHVPRFERSKTGEVVFPFVDLMSEIYRCLKPGGLFIAVTPAFPSREAFRDPTHINFIAHNTAQVFGVEAANEDFRPMYGFRGKFFIEHNEWLYGGGPSLTIPLILSIEKSGASRKIQVILKLFIRRVRISLWMQKSSHLLWVLRRPIEDSELIQ